MDIKNILDHIYNNSTLKSNNFVLIYLINLFFILFMILSNTKPKINKIFFTKLTF